MSDKYHVPFFKPAVKLSKYGRASSGIVVYMKKELCKYFNYLCDFPCGLVFNVSADLLGFPTLFFVCYLPPSGSSFYKGMNANGMTILQETLSNVTCKYPDQKLILTGDFNARTKDANDFIVDDCSTHLPLPDVYPEDNFDVPRNSKDNQYDINEYGHMLLEMCCTFSVHLLNGHTRGDTLGEYTCITANGTSIVDYTVVSTSLFDKIIKYEIGHYDQFTHLPQSFEVAIVLESVVNSARQN